MCMIRFAKTEIPEIFNKLARKFNEKREHFVLKYVVKAEGGKEISITVKYEPEGELTKEAPEFFLFTSCFNEPNNSKVQKNRKRKLRSIEEI